MVGASVRVERLVLGPLLNKNPRTGPGALGSALRKISRDLLRFPPRSPPRFPPPLLASSIKTRPCTLPGTPLP
eukprot:2349326-Pyramimonas_sp.AAC.1